MAFLRRGRCFALTHACDRHFFSGEARAPRTCAKRIFRIGGDGKVCRGVYLRLYKSCTKICILAASTGWEAHRRRTAVFISRENAVFWPQKIDYGEDDLKNITRIMSSYYSIFYLIVRGTILICLRTKLYEYISSNHADSLSISYK